MLLKNLSQVEDVLTLHGIKYEKKWIGVDPENNPLYALFCEDGKVHAEQAVFDDFSHAEDSFSRWTLSYESMDAYASHRTIEVASWNT